MKKVLLMILLFTGIGISSVCAQTISVTFGNDNDIKRYGKENAWQIKFCSDGTIIKHGWHEAGGDRHKIDGSDTYDYGRYVITNNTPRRKDIKITWKNGREETCYISYVNKYAELYYNRRQYDEF